MKSRVIITSIIVDNQPMFQLHDNNENSLQIPRVRRLVSRYQSIFFDLEELIILSSITYIQLRDFIESLNSCLDRLEIEPIVLDEEVSNFIEINEYAINEHRIAGLTIKDYDDRWKDKVDSFSKILDNEIFRPLLPQQVQASFYLAVMKRAANFSVPGAGKTAMMYGAYAYLSSEQVNVVDKVVVVCPINAFEAWKTEYSEVFGEKRKLNFMNLRDKKYSDYRNIRLDWGRSNVVVINYESLEPRVNILNELINENSMIVFDEVHRIKGVNGRRALAALKLGKNANHRFVLTGTPIPNTYKDIYNFLHLLYDNEYDSFFGWDLNDLENPTPLEVNNRVAPFFWRTNKTDLGVPRADDDKIISVLPSSEQKLLLNVIYENERNILSLYIRLLQASTNPSLLLSKVNFEELGLLDEEYILTQDTALDDEEKRIATLQAYQKFELDKITSNKFETGIKLIIELVRENKKVIVWAMFIDTMLKVVRRLQDEGILVNIIYGSTPKEDRVSLINEFRDGAVEVLVSNPNTLGESISLHQSVHDAVYLEYNFNLTFMLQSRDRIHRLGLSENQYTRYYYLLTQGYKTSGGFIDQRVYDRLKEKEEVMLNAIDGELLLPEVTDDYFNDITKIVMVKNDE